MTSTPDYGRKMQPPSGNEKGDNFNDMIKLSDHILDFLSSFYT